MSEKVLETLGKASRRYALLSLGGFLIVILAFVYSFYQLRSLESIKEEKVREIADLDQKKSEAESQLGQVQIKLEAANKAYQGLNHFADEVSRTNRDVANQALDKTIESDPSVADVVPRVYIEILGEQQRNQAREIAEVLEKHEYLIPPFEVVGKKMPDKPQIRYYRDAEAQEVNTIAQFLMTIHIQAEPRLMTGVSPIPRPRRYELWLGTTN